MVVTVLVTVSILNANEDEVVVSVEFVLEMLAARDWLFELTVLLSVSIRPANEDERVV